MGKRKRKKSGSRRSSKIVHKKSLDKERKKAYDLIVEKSKTRSDFGNLKIQKFKNSETQKFRNSKTQKLGGLELWNFGI